MIWVCHFVGNHSLEAKYGVRLEMVKRQVHKCFLKQQPHMEYYLSVG